MVDLEEYIARYAELGWSMMLIPPGQKKFTDEGWPTAPDEVAPMLRAVRAGGDWNLAVRLGERSGYLADVDLDSDAARTLAPALLPPTAAVFGRATAKDPTHRLYLCPDGPLGNGTVTLTGQCSQRWTGAYTVFPPSTHPDGSTYEWIPLALAQGPPAVRWSTLLDATREVAAGALLLGVYPQWQALRLRHYSTLALSAALLRAGWALPRVERFVYAVAVAAGDEEADARVTNARTTADRLARGERLGGWSALVSNAGADVVTRLQRFLGIDPYASGGDAWAGVVRAQGTGNGSTSTPPSGGGSTPSTTPAAGAKGTNQAPVAPVITTAQQAAQTASQKVKQPTLSSNEVAMAVAVALRSAVPIVRDEGQQLYHYAGGVYHSRGTELYLREKIAAEVLTHYGAEYLDKGIEDQVLHRLLVGAPDLEERPNPWLLNLENGLLDLRTMVLGPHDPAVRTTLKLPVVYDPTADCPKIEAFCRQVFPQDAYDAGVPWEVMALCACPVHGIDKAVLFFGEGANGKGIYLDVAQTFVGPHNTSSVSLQRIGDDRFATADLRGKLLNLCADLPTKRLEDSGDFKIIVSQETVRAQRKNQPAFDFRPFCRLLFSANNLPESADSSRGYIRRWHIIPFMQTFEPGDALYRPRPELLAELRDPAEMSGLLNRVIPAMLHFLSGGAPTSTPSMDEAIEEFIEATDDFAGWLLTQIKGDIHGEVFTSDISARWKNRQERRRLPGHITWQAIAKAMHEHFPKAVAKRPRTGGTGQGQNQATGQSTAQGAKRRGYGGVSWINPW